MVKPRRKLTRLQRLGAPSHINAREDRLLRARMPEAHGDVIRSGILAEAGRMGDDRVTKLIPAEAALLKSRGGSGTINPATGLREYGDGMGGSDNPGGGHNGDQGPGGVGGPSGPGHGGVAGGNDGGYGPSSSPGGSQRATTVDDPFGFSLFNSPLPGISPAAGLGLRGYDPTTMASVESMLNTPSGYRADGYGNLSMRQYSKPDTISRLVETYLWGPPPSYQMRGQVPGRYGSPTGLGPGAVGTAVANLAGGPMSAAMNLGTHMDMAMSPESRAASLAENQAQGSKNSTGQDHDTSDGLGSARPGGASAVNTGLLGEQKPGGTRSEVPQMNLDQGTLPGVGSLNRDNTNSTPNFLPQAIKNEMADYIWRGRSGLGLGMA